MIFGVILIFRVLGRIELCPICWICYVLNHTAGSSSERLVVFTYMGGDVAMYETRDGNLM